MRYELVNPSDEIYFEAETDEIAFVAVQLVSCKYAAKRTTDGELAVGFFFFGIDDVIFKQRIGTTIEEFLSNNKSELKKTLKSFSYAHSRSSMNRIVENAHAIADQVEQYGKHKENKVENSPEKTTEAL